MQVIQRLENIGFDTREAVAIYTFLALHKKTLIKILEQHENNTFNLKENINVS